MRETSKSTLAVMRAALAAATKKLPRYWHKKSPHRFTVPQIFSILVLKQFMEADYRFIVCMLQEWSDVRQVLALKRVPAASTLCEAFGRIMSDKDAANLMDETVRMALSIVEQASVDSTGLESSHVSRYYVKRCGKKMEYKTYPKLSAVIDNETHLFLSSVIDEGPQVDHVEFKDAVSRAHARCPFGQLLGDAAYDSEANHRCVREKLHADAVIKVRRRQDGRPPRGPWRRSMHDNFPARAYGQRRHIESAFSQFKRTLGSALTARTRKRRQQELALRIITFNLMLIFFFIHFAAPDQH
jgi:hypothetical protein